MLGKAKNDSDGTGLTVNGSPPQPVANMSRNLLRPLTADLEGDASSVSRICIRCCSVFDTTADCDMSSGGEIAGFAEEKIDHGAMSKERGAEKSPHGHENAYAHRRITPRPPPPRSRGLWGAVWVKSAHLFPTQQLLDQPVAHVIPTHHAEHVVRIGVGYGIDVPVLDGVGCETCHFTRVHDDGHLTGTSQLVEHLPTSLFGQVGLSGFAGLYLLLKKQNDWKQVGVEKNDVGGIYHGSQTIELDVLLRVGVYGLAYDEVQGPVCQPRYEPFKTSKGGGVQRQLMQVVAGCIFTGQAVGLVVDCPVHAASL